MNQPSESPYRAGPAPIFRSLTERVRCAALCLIRAVWSPRAATALVMVLCVVLLWRYLESSDVAEFCYVEAEWNTHAIVLRGAIRGAPDRTIARVAQVYEATAIAQRLGCEVRP